MQNKFNPGQRVVLSLSPDEILFYQCVGGILAGPAPADQISEDQIFHVQDYVGNFHGEPMITLRETGDTQYLEKLFKPAKRERLKAARIRPNPYFSR
jgi:hypothetical protein